MPNILIIGFKNKEAKEIRKKVDKILVEDLSRSHDAMTTILSAKTKWCRDDARSPYLLVRNTSLAAAKAIAAVIHRKLDHVDIEYDKIDGFLAGKAKKP
jgi:hypothetical protein